MTVQIVFRRDGAQFAGDNGMRLPRLVKTVHELYKDYVELY